MTDEEYAQTQSTLTMLAQVVSGLDLPAFLERIAKAETTGPFLDPTLYRKANRDLQRVKRLAYSASRFRKTAIKVGEEIEAEKDAR